MPRKLTHARHCSHALFLHLIGSLSYFSLALLSMFDWRDKNFLKTEKPGRVCTVFASVSLIYIMMMPSCGYQAMVFIYIFLSLCTCA